jgi:hypothetical protein
MRLSSRSKTVREAEKIRLVDGVEHFRHGSLDYLVFESRDAERPLATIRFRNVGSTRRLCSVRSALHPRVQILEISLELRLVVIPRYTVNARGCIPLDRQECLSQSFDGDVVQERVESLFLVPNCNLSHTV